MAATHGPHSHSHSHMWFVGLIGLAAGLALLIYVPTLPAISAGVLLFAGFHLAGAVVSLASLYVLTNGKIVARLRGKHETRFDFGWVPAWTYGPWIAALICVATAVAAQTVAPSWWPLAMVFLLLGAAFFAGGLVTDASGRYENAFLPMVDLLSHPEGRILDGGCGAAAPQSPLAGPMAAFASSLSTASIPTTSREAVSSCWSAISAWPISLREWTSSVAI